MVAQAGVHQTGGRVVPGLQAEEGVRVPQVPQQPPAHHPRPEDEGERVDPQPLPDGYRLYDAEVAVHRHLAAGGWGDGHSAGTEEETRRREGFRAKVGAIKRPVFSSGEGASRARESRYCFGLGSERSVLIRMAVA